MLSYWPSALKPLKTEVNDNALWISNASKLVHKHCRSGTPQPPPNLIIYKSDPFSAVVIRGFTLSETMFRRVLCVQGHPGTSNTRIQGFTLEDTVTMISVISSVNGFRFWGWSIYQWESKTENFRLMGMPLNLYSAFFCIITLTCISL